jgi:archaellum biogenesis ATPase FlaH
MSDNKALGYLGYPFQIKLLSQLVLDKVFAESILPIFRPEYFDGDVNCLFICKLIIEHHENYNTSPSFDVLESTIRTQIRADQQQKIMLDVLAEIRRSDQTDAEWAQEKAFKFCKQQELKKAMQKAAAILESGDFDRYDDIEEFIKTALSFGIERDAAISVFHNLEDVMIDDYRDTIPLGIEGLDNLFKGGVAKGEILVILAPMGTGKTTFLSKIANSAFNHGSNVLQIFFEDNVREIQRKHICCWTGVPLTEMNAETAADATHKKTLHDLKDKPNKLLLQRWSSDTKTITDIKSYIRKLKSDGVIIDMVVIDYIDCILPEHGTDDTYNDEGKIMRKFESMCHELNVAGVTATQGNRASISSTLVTNDQMGGSIKKAQIGHIVISIAKTLQQKDTGLATMAILKSRVSKDGLVFENCIFNNEKMLISTEQSETFLGFETNKSNNQKKRAAQLYQERVNQRQGYVAPAPQVRAQEPVAQEPAIPEVLENN